LAQVGLKPDSTSISRVPRGGTKFEARNPGFSASIMKTAVVVLGCLVTLVASAPTDSSAAPQYDGPNASTAEAANISQAVNQVSPMLGGANSTDADLDEAAEELAPAPAPVAKVLKAKLVTPEDSAPVSTPAQADDVKTTGTVKSDDIYSKDRTTPDKATSLSGDDMDIDASVRERIEQDSQRIGKVAENLVGVQGDINRVEKEVLGKVFDMSTMKSFLDKHEAAIKDHEHLDKEQEDLNKQATALSKQLDKATKESSTQDKKHRASMTKMSSTVAEDKATIQGLEKELVPLVEMQKEVDKLPPVNANLTAQNTKAVAAAQVATEELIFEKSKLKTYQGTTKNLMSELVKQHDYAQKCRERLYQLNTQLHEIKTKEAKIKYDDGLTAAQGEAMEKALLEKNKLIEVRLAKAKTNLQTITFAKGNMKSKIGALQTEGQIELEKLKDELGKLRQQSASIETAMMAKISNRKLIEKALRGANVQMTDMQERLLAGRLDKLRRNNTQMTADLTQIRTGLEKAQVNTAQAEAQRTQLQAQSVQVKQQAANKTMETQDVAREALAKVVAARQEDDAAQEQAQKATMEAQASMLVKCSAIWAKEHTHVFTKLKKCQQIKLDLGSARASVAALTSAVKSAQGGGMLLQKSSPAAA